MLDPVVGALVTCQPAVPLPAPVLSRAVTRRAIGVSKVDLMAAANRAEMDDVPLLGFRFKHD
jgi:hypothetical protein